MHGARMWPSAWGRQAGTIDDTRWVVLDVESSGLDAARDRLLAIAAVSVRHDGRRAWIDLADSFEALVQQPTRDVPPDKANILVHGIGIGAQGRGGDASAVLTGFEAFVGGSPLLGFHAAFDRRMIERASHAALGRRLRNPWLDIADLAAVLLPQLEARTLDDWLEALHIDCAQRHQAAADTLATAELLLRLWPAAQAEGAKDFRGFERLASRRRWLS
jgi:DNA polymerase III subunit epsilon